MIYVKFTAFSNLREDLRVRLARAYTPSFSVGFYLMVFQIG